MYYGTSLVEIIFASWISERIYVYEAREFAREYAYIKLELAREYSYMKLVNLRENMRI